MAGKDRPVMCPTALRTVASLSGDSVKAAPNDANANQGGKVRRSLCRNIEMTISYSKHNWTKKN